MSEPTEIEQLRAQNARQAKILRQKISELRFPPLSHQRVLDAGINVFALHLVSESIGKILPTISDTEIFFEFEHRGVRINIKAQLAAS